MLLGILALLAALLIGLRHAARDAEMVPARVPMTVTRSRARR